MNKITDKKSFIDETKPNLELNKYSADFDYIDEMTDASFCCVEKNIEDVVPKAGILGIVMSLNFNDNGKMPDTPEASMVDGCEIFCTKTEETFVFNGPYNFYPMKKEADGSYTMKMLFYCEENPDKDGYCEIEHLEDKFKDQITNVKLNIVAHNGFSYDIFSLNGEMILDGNSHTGKELCKEQVTDGICAADSLTFYGNE